MAKVKVERERASINLKSMCTGKHTAHLPTHTCTYMGKGIFTHMYLLSYKEISEDMKNPYHVSSKLLEAPHHARTHTTLALRNSGKYYVL